MRELRRLRDQRGLTLQETADRLGWSRARVSRLETGQTRPHHGDVDDLLEVYGVEGEERDSLVMLAREARRRGWWTAYVDVFTGSYVALEDDASLVRSWDPQVVHGLLQTEEYARAVIGAGRMLPDQAQIDRRIAARRIRQGLLDRPSAPRIHVILDEAVLHRVVGGPEVMAGQLNALCEATERPNVTLQVLPFDAGAHAGLDGGFTILSYPDPADPDIAYVEGTMGDVYLESAEEVAQHDVRFRRLRDCSLPPAESVELIAATAERFVTRPPELSQK